MTGDIKYTVEFSVVCNKISIDLLELLDNFLQEKNILNQNTHKSFHFRRSNFELSEKNLADLIKNEKFVSNLDKNFSVTIIALDSDWDDYFALFIRKEDEIEITGSIKDVNEHVAIGYKEIIEQFLKDNFIENNLKNEKIELKDNTSLPIKQKSTLKMTPDSVTLVKKDLDWTIPSIKLTHSDLIELENLLRLDLKDIKEYEITVKPCEKFVQKKQNALQYNFKSVDEFQTKEDLLKNIKNYSVEFDLRADGISVSLNFSNENRYSNKLRTKGNNQTLYYGKYKLLTDYLKTKKNWYFWLHSEIFANFICPPLIIATSYVSLIMFLFSLEKGLWFEALKVLLFVGIFLVLFFSTPKILKRNNFVFVKENVWSKNNLINTLWVIALGLFTNIITPYFQQIVDFIFKK